MRSRLAALAGLLLLMLAAGCAGYRTIDANLTTLSDENLPGREVRVTQPDGTQQVMVVRRIEWPRLLGSVEGQDTSIDLRGIETVEVRKRSWLDDEAFGYSSWRTVGVVGLLVLGAVVLAL